jgi:hypothetical protein
VTGSMAGGGAGPAGSWVSLKEDAIRKVFGAVYKPPGAGDQIGDGDPYKGKGRCPLTPLRTSP